MKLEGELGKKKCEKRRYPMKIYSSIIMANSPIYLIFHLRYWLLLLVSVGQKKSVF